MITSGSRVERTWGSSILFEANVTWRGMGDVLWIGKNSKLREPPKALPPTHLSKDRMGTLVNSRERNNGVLPYSRTFVCDRTYVARTRFPTAEDGTRTEIVNLELRPESYINCAFSRASRDTLRRVNDGKSAAQLPTHIRKRQHYWAECNPPV